jgi:RNA polymerase sigma-70 factor, ECF subfamily
VFVARNQHPHRPAPLAPELLSTSAVETSVTRLHQASFRWYGLFVESKVSAVSSSAPDESVASSEPEAYVSAEQATIAALQAGDKRAFRDLFTNNRLLVTRLILRMGIPHSELEDLIQEVFVQVHRSVKDFRGQSKLSTWVHRIAVNVVLMHRRAQKSRPFLISDEERTLRVFDETQNAPDEDAARKERMRAFARLLDKLTDKKREVFVLHELEGLSPAEISAQVGAPVLTVRTRLFYARKELDALLGQEPSLAAFQGALTLGPSPDEGKTESKDSDGAQS